MSLRQINRRQTAVIRDGGLLRALLSEIDHELSSPYPFQVIPQSLSVSDHGDSPYHFLIIRKLSGGGGLPPEPFTFEWDDLRAKEVVLRGADAAVTAKLGPVICKGSRALPHHALMKVCLAKPKCSVMQFDCMVHTPAWLRMMENVLEEDEDGVGVDGEGEDYDFANFSIYNVCHHTLAAGFADASKYVGPRMSSLRPQIKEACKDYLATRGINEEFATFLLNHLVRKEQNQYVNWLQKLEAYVTNGTSA